MDKFVLPEIRLGSTSFLLHENYVPAVRFTAERCSDVSLLLLETGEHGEYLITPQEVDEIARILAGEDTSLHVHLPTDADFSTPESTRILTQKILNVIDRTAPLHPHSFVLHVETGTASQTAPFCPKAVPVAPFPEWVLPAVQKIAAALPDPAQLCIENLEHHPPAFWDGLLQELPVSRCFDIGHIWKDNGVPTTLLKAWLPRIRVIHLHGMQRKNKNGRQYIRDHSSLQLMPPAAIDAVVHPLLHAHFPGVLCVEVFRYEDFVSSFAALRQSFERYTATEARQ